jgi:hypothetical protein
MKRVAIISLSAISILAAIILVLAWQDLHLVIRGITPRDMKPWNTATTFRCVEYLFSAFVMLWIAISLIGNIKYRKITRFILLATSIVPFYLLVTFPLALLHGYELMSIETKVLSIVFSVITAIFALAVISTLIIFATGVLKPQKDRSEIPNIEVKTSKSAIWSFICGIFSISLILPLIPAIILGIIALVDIRKSKGLLKGKEWAIAGLVLGCSYTFFFLLALLNEL